MAALRSWIKNPRVWSYGFLIMVFFEVVYAASDPSGQSKWPELDLSWIYLISTLAFALLFIWFFTQRSEAEAKQDDKEIQRWMIFSYAFMFFAIGIAIWPFVGEKDINPEKIMKQPISIFLLSCSEDEDTATELSCRKKGEGASQVVERKQWVINIGGWVKMCSFPDGSKGLCVRGGLVVPLYFVVLALIGGAVSLTRRVPEYQKRSSLSYVGTEKEPRLDPPTTREYLVFQIVQFISAPFIAAVAYYLVSPETRAVGVAVGFTSGFGSEAILLMIRGVVEKVSPASERAPKIGAAACVVMRQNQGVGNVTLKVVGKSDLTGQTDGHGHFVIHEIPVGDQAIEASDKQVNAITKVNIQAGKTALCRIELP